MKKLGIAERKRHSRAWLELWRSAGKPIFQQEFVVYRRRGGWTERISFGKSRVWIFSEDHEGTAQRKRQSFSVRVNGTYVNDVLNGVDGIDGDSEDFVIARHRRFPAYLFQEEIERLHKLHIKAALMCLDLDALYGFTSPAAISARTTIEDILNRQAIPRQKPKRSPAPVKVNAVDSVRP